MKTGLFFGSFNPVHSGHLVIASYMNEFTDLDQVWFVVSPHNPLKDRMALLQDYHRLDLVKAGIGDNRKLKASDVEFKLSKPSYTIHTLEHLHAQFPEHEFVLILGADSLVNFNQWKDYAKILERYVLYVYPRFGVPDTGLDDHPSVRRIDAPVVEISSTFIRKAIREKKDVRYMMPEKVWEMIDEKGFYKS